MAGMGTVMGSFESTARCGSLLISQPYLITPAFKCSNPCLYDAPTAPSYTYCLAPLALYKYGNVLLGFKGHLLASQVRASLNDP